jgi:uncharacterized protein
MTFNWTLVGYTDKEPLHLAVEKGDLNHVRELISSGLKADEKDIHQRTPLMIAARDGAIDLAKLLIESGANVNAKDRRSSVWDGRRTPLHYACDNNRVEMAGLLIDNGADPDSHSQYWFTPLSKNICEKGREKLIDLLLEKGANPNGPEKCNKTPLQAAAGTNNLPLLKRLLRLGADPNRVVGETALHATRSFECARELIANGADVNIRDISGSTALHTQIAVIHSVFVRFLIKAGADVNATAKDSGYTPLHRLALCPNLDNAKVLIEAGANLNVLSKEKQTALDICLYILKKPASDKVVFQQMIDLLRLHGGKTAEEL